MRALTTLAAALLTTATAYAVDFHPIAGVTSDTAGTDFFAASNLIEGPGIGFDAAEPHNRTSTLTWVTNAPNGGAGDYFNPTPAPAPRLVIDLGSPVQLNEISLWGYADTNGNGMTDFDLRFSDTTTFTGAPVSIGGMTQPVTPRQSFSFPLVSARYVELTPTDNLFAVAPPGGDRVGFGEVAFEVPVVSPNPVISVPAEVELALTRSIEVFDIEISNIGGAELTISGVNFIGTNAAAFNAPSVPASILSPGSDVIEVQFDPAGLEGPVSATLQIMSNDPDTATAEILLTGSVPPAQQDIVVPGPVDRGSIAIPDTFDLSVKNGGSAVLTINGTNFTGPNAAAFSVISTPASIAALGSENFQIQIDPAGLEGPISATLQIMSDDPDTPTAEVMISATALVAAQFYPIAGVTSDTEPTDFFPAPRLIEGPGVGFDASPPHDRTSTLTWVTNAPNGGTGDYFGPTPTPSPRLVFDLGSSVTLSEISLWGYADTNGNGMTDFDLRFSDTTTFTGAPVSISGMIQDVTPRQSFTFLPVKARYVELTPTDNLFGVAPPGGDRVGFGEVAFEITNARVSTLFFAVEGQGDNLVLTWESQGGKLYNLRSVTDPSVPIPPGTEPPAPLDWPIFSGNEDIAATPPENVLTIPRPADPERYFLIEEFNAPPASVFFDDFESGQGSWTAGADDPFGNTAWEFGAPANVGPATANSGTNCFGTNLAATYGTDSMIWLRSPEIDLTTAGGATLNYANWYDIEVMFDSGALNVLDINDNVLASVQSGIEGSSAGWEQVSVPLPPAALGQVIKLEFRFNSDEFQSLIGWYVDDVGVTVP